MTEFIPREDDDSSDPKIVLALLKFRVQRMEKMDIESAAKQDRMIDMLHKIDSRLDKGERRIDNHSVSIRALQDDAQKIRQERREALKEMSQEFKSAQVNIHQKFQDDLEAVAVNVGSKGNVATMWTAITAMATALGTAVLAIFGKGGAQ